MRFSGLVFFSLVLLVPGVSQALDVDVYGGLGTGHVVQKNSPPNDDSSDTGEKVYLGSRFLGPIGLEIAYYDLGQYENHTSEAYVYGASAVFYHDIRGMSLFAKAGIIEWNKSDIATGAKTSGEDVSYGFGINLAVDKHVLFRTEIEYFRKVGKNETTGDPGTEMSMLSFGVNFRF